MTANNITDGSVNPVAIAETQVLLEQMASLASHGDRMCYHMGADGNLDQTTHQLMFLRDLVSRLGWLADLGLGKLNGGQCVGGAEEWMLPPAYRWPSEKAAKAEKETA